MMKGIVKTKKASSLAKNKAAAAAGQPSLEQFIFSRDYTGALALLEFRLKCQDGDTKDLLLWIGYCSFHLGNFKRAEDAYKELLDAHDVGREIYLYIAACYFFQQMYDESEKEAFKGPDSSLKVRLLFNIAHRTADEAKLMEYHRQLQDKKDDQLSLAAVHYLRSHHQEATDIYKRLLLENREDLALNVYVAMCYYKLDYYDVSLEILAVYLQSHPESPIGVNLKACNHFRLYNGKAAEAELKFLSDKGVNLQGNELIRHNTVVFSNGELALQVLPGLVDSIPEARLNLIIYYLRHGAINEATELVNDLDPATPQEYIIKGVVHSTLGQATGNREHLKMAQQCFQLVGTSAHECDTIPGRQCMASCYFLMRQFDDVNIYLNSVKAYMYNDDDFNFNHGISLAATRNYKAAEEAFLLIHNEAYKVEYVYTSWLARCYVMNGNPRSAWELYLKLNNSNESFNLLQLIANDCYRMGHFLFAAKAFDVLERLDSDPEYWEGKRGACVGVFQQVIAGKASRDDLQDVLSMIRNTSNPQVEYIVRIIKKWCKDNNVRIHPSLRCHYDVMELDRKTTFDEIKKKYKQLALKYHPDRNHGQEEQATQLFKELSAAYSVLSDPNERLWYDEHRDAILQGGDGTHSTSDREASLWRYFNTSCFHGTDDSSPGSFYSVYRSVFRDIHEREQIPDRDYCSFGASSTPVPEMLQFYARWENFVSVLTFADADIYHTLDAPNRATRRVMEKENLKQRETARKEYTEQVRSLARFVKKRDPRYLAHEADLKRRKIEEDEAKKRLKIESELLRKEIRCKKQAEYENDTEALEQREKERKKAFLLADNEDDADEHCHADDEQLLQDQLRLLKMSDPDDLVYTGGDAARTDTIEYNCDICSKVFRSEMQLKQHLSSKPHLKKLKDISKSSKAARSAPPLQL